VQVLPILKLALSLLAVLRYSVESRVSQRTFNEKIRIDEPFSEEKILRFLRIFASSFAGGKEFKQSE